MKEDPTPPLSPELFDLEEGILWVMHCAEGPVPLSAVAAFEAFLPRETRPWTLRWQEDFLAVPQETRQAAAALLGGHADDVTLLPSTSTGLVTVAQGIDWQPGDEVVLPLGEFPSNYYPWRSLAPRGVALREVPLWEGHQAGARAWDSTPPTAGTGAEERLLDALAPETRVLSVSWVRFQDGLVLDLGRLAAGCGERLGELDAAGRLGSIVSLYHGGRGPQGLDTLLKRGFGRGIYASVREGYLRVALHGWHTAGDVDRVLEWLASGEPES